MYQPWIFAATIAAGSGLFAYAAQQAAPPAPDIAPAPEAVRVIPIPTPEPVVEPASTFMTIEPIVIEATRKVARASTAVPKPAVAEPAVAERPCSDWRAISPSHVTQGKPLGTVSVRELCR
jgi:hypothetical protein